MLLAILGLLTGVGIDITLMSIALAGGIPVGWTWLTLPAAVTGFAMFVVAARNRLRLGAVIAAIVLTGAALTAGAVTLRQKKDLQKSRYELVLKHKNPFPV